MSLKDKIDTLAEHLVNKAILKDTPFVESIDAFKELRSYYALVAKEKPDEDDDESFGSLQQAVKRAQEQPNGSTRVRTRRGDS